MMKAFFFFAGAPALTSRNFKEADFVKVVEFLDRGVKIALDAQHSTGARECRPLLGCKYSHLSSLLAAWDHFKYCTK